MARVEGTALADWRSRDGKDEEIDARVLPIVWFNHTRHRDFRDAVSALGEVTFADWKGSGTRTLWCLRFLAKKGAPAAQNVCWKHIAHLVEVDFGVAEREAIMRSIEDALEYVC